MNVDHDMYSMQLAARSKLHLHADSLSGGKKILYQGVRYQQKLSKLDVGVKFWGGQNDVTCGTH